MWCRSAVSFSFLFLVTAPRMRSCACDTASRLCVRTVLCNSAFLSVPLLPSTGSAAGGPALFAGFAGIISESDFFAPFIIGYGLRPSRCGPGTASQGGDEDIPVPAQEVCVHAEGLKTTRGGEGPCDDGPAPVAFCLPRRHRHPGLHCFRRSIPRLYVPLSTLRVLPHSSVPRMTRGQRGSLLLHCDGLAPSTSCRSPGAPRLNGWPMRPPVNASPRPSRATAHDSGPMWIATPSSQGTCTLYSLPVSRRLAHVFRFAPELGHCPVQSALRIRAKTGRD